MIYKFYQRSYHAETDSNGLNFDEFASDIVAIDISTIKYVYAPLDEEQNGGTRLFNIVINGDKIPVAYYHEDEIQYEEQRNEAEYAKGKDADFSVTSDIGGDCFRYQNFILDQIIKQMELLKKQ